MIYVDLFTLYLVSRDTNPKTTVATPNFAQENQAIKRQKLEGGNSRQVTVEMGKREINKPGFF